MYARHDMPAFVYDFVPLARSFKAPYRLRAVIHFIDIGAV